MARHPSAAVTAFVTAAVNAPPPASVARTATLEPVVAPEPTQPETSLSVASSPGVDRLRQVLAEADAFKGVPGPDVMVPMTPEEEAAFDRGIRF